MKVIGISNHGSSTTYHDIGWNFVKRLTPNNKVQYLNNSENVNNIFNDIKKLCSNQDKYVIVVIDDINLNIGSFKLSKIKNTGHNGLKQVYRNRMYLSNCYLFRIGIGDDAVSDRIDMDDYVLSNISIQLKEYVIRLSNAWNMAITAFFKKENMDLSVLNSLIKENLKI